MSIISLKKVINHEKHEKSRKKNTLLCVVCVLCGDFMLVIAPLSLILNHLPKTLTFKLKKSARVK